MADDRINPLATDPTATPSGVVRALRDSETLSAMIIESALDCIIIMDDRGLITEFNPAAERTFGHARAAVVGRPLAEVIIPPRHRQTHWRG
jgi:PAS domain S-box-containing protein